MVVQRCEEVRVDGEDNGAAAELDAADEPLHEFEAEACSGTHDGDAGEKNQVKYIEAVDGWCQGEVRWCAFAKDEEEDGRWGISAERKEEEEWCENGRD